MPNTNLRIVCPHAQWVKIAGPGDEYTVQLHSDGGHVYLVHTNDDPPAPSELPPAGGQKLMPISENPMLQGAGTLRGDEHLYAWAWVIDTNSNGLALSVALRTA